MGGLESVSKKPYGILFFIIFCNTYFLIGQSPITIRLDSTLEYYSLNEGVLILTDTTNSLSFEDARSPKYLGDYRAISLAPEEEKIDLNPAYTYWAILTIDNQLAEGNITDWRLYLGRADSIEVYVPDLLEVGRYQQLIAGDWYGARFKDLPYPANIARVPISLSAKTQTTIYIRYRSARQYYINPDLRLMRKEVFENWDANIFRRREGVLFGFILTMVLISLIMGFGTRDRAFFYHGFFLLGVFVYILDVHKVLINLPVFAELPSIKNIIVYGFITCLDVSYLLFVSQFSGMKENFPIWYRRINLMIYLRIAINIAVSIFYIWSVNEPLSDIILSLTVIVEYVFFILPMVWMLYQSGVKMYRFLIFGTLFIVVDVLMNVISVILLENPPILLTHFGIIGEISFFTYGLGYRFFAMKQQRIEARKRAELNEMKNQFFTNITHEFRTPIAVIKGMSERISEEWSNPSSAGGVHEALHHIDEYSNQLLNLVNQLLDLSKIEAGFIQHRPGKGDIIFFIKNTIAALQPIASQKQVKVTYSGVCEELIMDFDPDNLNKILVNLINNAIKFSPENREVAVRVDVISSDKLNESLRIKIKDFGVGIEKNELPYIFDRYYQAAAGLQAPNFGAGIGLSLVKELIKLIGGKIFVESTPGNGTVFTITLPIHRSPNQVMEIQPPDKDKDKSSEHEKNLSESIFHLPHEDVFSVLLVEDNPGMIEVLRFSLSKNFQVSVARNGREGIQKAINEVPDLIITDLMMPEADGIQLIKEVRGHLASSHIPIIVLTAKTDERDKVSALTAGALDFLNKPVNTKELYLKIESIMQFQSNLLRKLQGDAVNTPMDIEGSQDVHLQRQLTFYESVVGTISTYYPQADFNVENLASQLHLSRSQLHRKVKQLFDVTPSALITQKRIEAACQLLERTDKTVGEIAELVGYQEHSYFTRVFTKEKGCTPSEYRFRLNQPNN